MADTASDLLMDILIDWNVEIIFGLPGDGINGLMEALRKRKDKIRFIQVRHEEAAAFMACAYAKYTGRLGVCLATSGPGGIHLLNGLYDAKLDGQPVLAITGHHYHDLIGTPRAARCRPRQAFHGRRSVQHAHHGIGACGIGNPPGLPYRAKLPRCSAHQLSYRYTRLHNYRTVETRCTRSYDFGDGPRRRRAG